MNVLLSMIAVFVAAFYFGDSVSEDIGMEGSASREVAPAQAPPPISSNETSKTEDAQPRQLNEITKKTSQTLRKRNATATGKRR
ncbi:hypothetical protein HDU76_011948 [Blyttiomyces sp. JEL0837]|nr:hypothetical protein HDU76_011948 [Blyttiomyces sp. JEL0837]